MELNQRKLTPFERKLLGKICVMLEPFESTTISVQREKTVSANLTIPTKLELKHKLKQLKDGKIERQTVKFIEIVEGHVEIGLSIYEHENEHVLAIMLDPRFKLHWCEPTEYKHREELLKGVAMDAFIRK